ncbi:MAG: hypothetical protein ACFN0Y_03130 [Lactobacillus sp.]
MNIKLADLTKKVADQAYLQNLQTFKNADLTKTKLTQVAKALVKEAQTAASNGSLLQTQLTITGRRPVTFGLELNIVNLPYDDYKKIANFCQEDQDYEVNVYVTTSSDYINASKFRIDQLATSDELAADPEQVTAKLLAYIEAKRQAIKDYEPKSPTKKSSKKAKRTSKK